MKLNLTSFAIIKEFKPHQEIKEKLLDLIKQTPQENLYTIDSYYSDNISKLDWSTCKDFERPWVKFILKKLQIHLDECVKNFSFQKAIIESIWFQQYVKNNRHGWHIHSGNYTGVYYLQLNKDSPKTELVDQAYNLITLNVKEGDIVIFPSFMIHRAPIIENEFTKTIISFNLNLDEIETNFLEKIKG